MIGLIQRVSSASVTVSGQQVSAIGPGILLLLGVERDDDINKAKKLCDKVLKYRIFADNQGKMNLNLRQVEGELLVVSQFTLVAETSKGNRPGFSRGASPELGEALYNEFLDYARDCEIPCQGGQFGADMQVALVNDGPVTFQFQV